MSKYDIYAVGYGIDPNTKKPVFGLKFKTWNECKPYIIGVVGAKYKGFMTEIEADAWLERVNSNNDCPWQDKADKIYAAKLHPVDQEFLTTCQDLGLSIHDTEHLMKMMFVNIVKYLKDNDCINELPFEE